MACATGNFIIVLLLFEWVWIVVVIDGVSLDGQCLLMYIVMLLLFYVCCTAFVKLFYVFNIAIFCVCRQHLY